MSLFQHNNNRKRHEQHLGNNKQQLQQPSAKRVSQQDEQQCRKLLEERRSLPIFYGRKPLITAMLQNDTVIVISETGSGKTTQLPQYLLEAQFARFGVIVCTQPRRVAAVTIANRVAREKNTPVGELVGYTVRFEDVTSQKTRLKYATDGMLLRESLLDPLLKKYSVVVLDEAHERSVQTDVLFGVVKAAQLKRKQTENMRPLKIVIMSATLHAEKFQKYFTGAKVCYLEGRRFPIKTMYTDVIQKDYLHASLIAAVQIHKECPPGDDILVFLTGQEEIESLTHLIKDIAPHISTTHGKILVHPLFSSLPQSEQLKAFSPAPMRSRKVILSTNIAETSVTIPGVKYVIDCGMVKAKSYNSSTGFDVLKVQPISKAQARQRSGRAGRECAGVCYRLYPEASFFALDEETVPEIKRCNLRGVILQLLSMGLKDVGSFDFLDPPTEGDIETSLKQLFLLGAVEKTEENVYKITEKGRTMCSFPLDPPLACCILAARELNCTEEIVTVVALMSVESLFYFPPNMREKCKKAQQKFASTQGDHISMLQFFRAYKHAKGNVAWCREHFVNMRALKTVVQIRAQLRDLCTRMHISLQSCGTDFTNARKALAAGLFLNSAERLKDGTYTTILQKQIVNIHPSSVLFHAKPAYVVFNELVQTSKKYIRDLSVVDPLWLVATGAFNRNALIPKAEMS